MIVIYFIRVIIYSCILRRTDTPNRNEHQTFCEEQIQLENFFFNSLANAQSIRFLRSMYFSYCHFPTQSRNTKRCYFFYARLFQSINYVEFCFNSLFSKHIVRTYWRSNKFDFQVPVHGPWFIIGLKLFQDNFFPIQKFSFLWYAMWLPIFGVSDAGNEPRRTTVF